MNEQARSLESDQYKKKKKDNEMTVVWKRKGR